MPRRNFKSDMRTVVSALRSSLPTKRQTQDGFSRLKAWLALIPRQTKAGSLGILIGTLVLVLALGQTLSLPLPAYGAYTATSLDADGNTHLASNTVNDTMLYDAANDSDPDTQSKLGVDPNWRNGVTRKSHALQMDGTDDYAQIASTSALQAIENANFTVEFWYKNGSGNVGTKAIVEKWAGGSGAYPYAFRLNGSAIYFARYNGTDQDVLSTSSVVTDGNWHQIAGVKSGNQLSLYVDGTLAATATTLAPTASNTVPVYLGSRGGNLAYVAGSVEELRISNTARYSSTFTPSRRFTEDTSTLGLWHFDEGSGQSIADSSQYLNNGTLGADSTASTDDPTWTSGADAVMDTGAGDKIKISDKSASTAGTGYDVRVSGSSALTYDATDDYVQTTAFGQTGTALTIEAWTKNAKYAGGLQTIIGDSGQSTSAGFIWIYRPGNTDDLRFQYANGTAVVNVIATGFYTGYDNAWVNMAIQADYTAGTIAFYRNGSLFYSYKAPDTMLFPSASRAKYIGRYNPGSPPWNGTIDELRISSGLRYGSTFTPSRRFATDSSTYGLWHFDEGTGTTTADSSGNGRTGTLMNSSSNTPAADGTTNGPIWSEGISNDPGVSTAPNWALPGYQFRKQLNVTNGTASTLDSGYGVESTENRGALVDNKQTRADGNDWRIQYQPTDAKRSLTFNGPSTHRVMVPTSPSLTGMSSLTIDTWIKRDPSSLGSRQVIMGKGTSQLANDNSYWLEINASNNPYFVVGLNGTSTCKVITTGGSTLTDTANWHHLVGQWDGTTAKIFLDGVADPVTTACSGGTVTTTAAPLGIGKLSDNPSYFFTGGIDEVRISKAARYKGNFTPSTTPFVNDSSTVGLWHMDEGSGQQVADATGSNNGVMGTDLTTTNDPTWVTADGAVSTVQEVPRSIPKGGDLNLDGTDDFASAPHAANQNGLPLTVEAWIKTTSSGTASGIVSKYLNSSANGYSLFLTAGKVNGFYYGASGSVPASSLVSTNTVNDGTWHHVAMVIDKKEGRLYIDGTLNSRKSWSGTPAPPTTTVPLQIGSYQRNADQSGGTQFAGQIDEARISNTARYTSNFTPSSSPHASDQYTVGLWHMDEGTGTTLNDSSGNGNTGTLLNSNLNSPAADGTVNGPIWVKNGGAIDSTNQTQFKTVAPIAGSATDGSYYLYYGRLNENGSAQSYKSNNLLLDGVNDYGLANNVNLSGTNAITVSFWFNKPVLTAAESLLFESSVNTNGSTTGFFFDLDTSNCPGYMALSIKGNAGYNYACYNKPTAGVWHHYVGILDKSQATNEVSLYLDGVLQTPFSRPQTLDNTNSFGNNPLYFGSRAGTIYYAKGGLEDFRIYNRVLTATEAAALYSNASSVASDGLVNHWKFDETSGTTAADSVGTNPIALTNFTFDHLDGWRPNATLLHASTEPTVTSASLIEQESPVFYQWRQVGGTWSARKQLSATETQLGSEGVYITFNPTATFSKNDYFKIASWAVEPFSTSSPQRGKKRSFPTKANLVASAGGVDIIDATTNVLWMRFPLGTTGKCNYLCSTAAAASPKAITALNGVFYVSMNIDNGSTPRYSRINIAQDNGYLIQAGSAYQISGAVAMRNANSYAVSNRYAVLPAASATLDTSAAAISGTQYFALATSKGVLLYNETTGLKRTYSRATDSSYSDVFLTSAGTLYGANTTSGGLDRWDSVQSDTADQSTSADVTYSTSSTPALRSNAINDISVSVGASTADYVSNEVALGTDLGTELIDEHSTQASALVRHYVATGNAGTSGWNSKQFGSALKFDGTDDSMNVPSITWTPTAFTVEFWINPATRASFNQHLGAVNGWGAFSFHTDNTGAIYVGTDVGSGRFVLPAGTLETNTWQHFAYTYDNRQAAFYKNGTLLASGTNALAGAWGGFWIGGNSTNDKPNGTFDEVRISSNARYGSNFTPPQTAFIPDANTIGLWHFDEQNDQTVYDESANANNGTLGATSAASTDDPTRVIPAIAGTTNKVTAVGLPQQVDQGRGLQFDGSNDFIKLPTAAGFDPGSTGAVTISAWGRAETTAFGGIFEYGDTIRHYQLDYSGGNILLRIEDTDNGNATLIQKSVPLGTWHHMVAVIDRGQNTMALYIDGLLISSKPIVTVLPAYVSPIARIGTLVRTNGKVPSSLDDIRVYNRALSATEASALYGGGTGGTVSNNGLVAWYKFDDGTSQTVTDSSGNGNAGTLGNTASVATDDPTAIIGTPVRNRSAMWVATNGAGADDGTLTAISLTYDRQIKALTSTASGLPDMDITSLSLGGGGLALVGTEVGAWNPGTAGFVVDDGPSFNTTATANSPIRVKGGSVRVKGGSVRVNGN